MSPLRFGMWDVAGSHFRMLQTHPNAMPIALGCLECPLWRHDWPFFFFWFFCFLFLRWEGKGEKNKSYHSYTLINPNQDS